VKLGIVLPSYFYAKEREKLADAAFMSLSRSEPLVHRVVLVLLVKAGTTNKYMPYMNELGKNFRVFLKTYDDLTGTEQKFAFGTSYLLQNFDVDTVTWLTDDTLFHSLWMWKLEGLIRRHPEAKAWSVYRSAFEFMHRTIKEENEDALVHSVCAHGMTFTRQEWKEWGITPEAAASYGVDGKLTLDVEHPEQRPGERWVTKQSWMDHTGKVGVHTSSDIPEYARDFVGAK
jgi:hypothetical protein